MVRILESLAIKLALMVGFLRRNQFDAAIMIQERGDGDPIIQSMRDRIGDDIDAEFNYDEVIKELAGAIQAGGEHADGEVIDLLVEAFSGAFPKSVLGSETLKRLRAALFDPRELEALRAAIHKRELHCSRCGRKLRMGMLLTLIEEASGVFTVWCATCMKPDYITCATPGCSDHVKLPEKIKQLLVGKEHLCSKHQEERARAANGEAPTAPDVPLPQGAQLRDHVVAALNDDGDPVLEWAQALDPAGLQGQIMVDRPNPLGRVRAGGVGQPGQPAPANRFGVFNQRRRR